MSHLEETTKYIQGQIRALEEKRGQIEKQIVERQETLKQLQVNAFEVNPAPVAAVEQAAVAKPAVTLPPAVAEHQPAEPPSEHGGN